MGKPGATGLTRIIHAARYSMQGFKATILAFPVSDSVVELILLIVMPWLTFTVEILNSAIEAVVDRFGDEYHELSGRAKDLGSAAVFVMLCLTGFTWLAILVA